MAYLSVCFIYSFIYFGAKIPSCVSFQKYPKVIFSGGGGALFWLQPDAGGQDGVGWRRGEEQQFEGGGGGMCDEMRCEVFPHSVGTCVKDSSRGRERTADAVLGRSEARAAEKGEQRKVAESLF